MVRPIGQVGLDTSEQTLAAIPAVFADEVGDGKRSLNLIDTHTSTCRTCTYL